MPASGTHAGWEDVGTAATPFPQPVNQYLTTPHPLGGTELGKGDPLGFGGTTQGHAMGARPGQGIQP